MKSKRRMRQAVNSSGTDNGLDRVCVFQFV